MRGSVRPKQLLDGTHHFRLRVLIPNGLISVVAQTLSTFYPTFTGMSAEVLLGHVHHVRILCRHARVGVAQKVLHSTQIAGVQ